MSYNGRMYDITPLQKRLEQAPSLKLVAQVSGISTKQIQRIRDGHNSPSLKTAAAIMSAMDLIAPVKRRAKEVAHG